MTSLCLVRIPSLQCVVVELTLIDATYRSFFNTQVLLGTHALFASIHFITISINDSVICYMARFISIVSSHNDWLVI